MQTEKDIEADSKQIHREADCAEREIHRQRQTGNRYEEKQTVQTKKDIDRQQTDT